MSINSDGIGIESKDDNEEMKKEDMENHQYHTSVNIIFVRDIEGVGD